MQFVERKKFFVRNYMSDVQVLETNVCDFFLCFSKNFAFSMERAYYWDCYEYVFCGSYDDSGKKSILCVVVSKLINTQLGHRLSYKPEQVFPQFEF